MAKKKKKKDKKAKKNESKKEVRIDLTQMIRDLHGLYQGKVDLSLANQDLSFEQYRILEILKEGPVEGYSLKQIRESLPNQTSNATRLVEKLRVKKMVQKKASSNDKRELRISLTPSGSEAYTTAHSTIDEIDAQVKGGLKKKELASLASGLKGIKKALA